MSEGKEMPSSKNASLYYASLYLALIPAFAVAYCRLPFHFYHATSRYEPSLVRDRIELEKAVEAFLVKSVAPTPMEARITRVRGIEFKDEEIVIIAEIFSYIPSFDLKGKPSKHGASLIGNEWLTIRTSEAFNVDADPRYPVKVTVRRQPPPPLNVEPTLREMFPQKSGVGGCGDDCGFLELPWDLRNQLIVFSNAINGFPSDASGNFERMLYFSAVTATTVGYGDTVPITSTARLLVASEAVIEIVVIGLFLNSLATRIAASGKSRQIDTERQESEHHDNRSQVGRGNL